MMKIDEIINKTQKLTKEVCEVVVDSFAKRHRRYFTIDRFKDETRNKDKRCDGGLRFYYSK